MKNRYWHNASDSYETQIRQSVENPGTSSYNWYGPFDTWGKAKADAIDYHRTDMNNARYAMVLLRGQLKRDLKVGKK